MIIQFVKLLYLFYELHFAKKFEIKFFVKLAYDSYPKICKTSISYLQICLAFSYIAYKGYPWDQEGATVDVYFPFISLIVSTGMVIIGVRSGYVALTTGWSYWAQLKDSLK